MLWLTYRFRGEAEFPTGLIIFLLGNAGIAAAPEAGCLPGRVKGRNVTLCNKGDRLEAVNYPITKRGILLGSVW